MEASAGEKFIYRIVESRNIKRKSKWISERSINKCFRIRKQKQKHRCETQKTDSAEEEAFQQEPSKTEP
jgi:hypothetical protein